MSPLGIGLQNLSQRDDSCAQVSPRPQASLARMSAVLWSVSFVLCPFMRWQWAGVCQRLQFLVFCCSGVLISWRSCVLVWMARGRHPFSGSFLHEWPSSRQTGGSVETCGQDMGCVRMCADLIILAARLDAFLCDFCRKLISSRHVCTHHQHSLPIVCAVWTWVWVSVQTLFAPYLRLILYE